MVLARDDHWTGMDFDRSLDFWPEQEPDSSQHFRFEPEQEPESSLRFVQDQGRTQGGLRGLEPRPYRKSPKHKFVADIC